MFPSDSFKRAIKVGQQGEEWALEYYAGRNVKDVRDDPFYRKQDIDFIVDSQTHEVKTDTFTTGNVVFETEAHGKPGAVWASRAQWWLYYFAHSGDALLIHLPSLQQWLHRMRHAERSMARGESRGVIIHRSDLETQPFVKVVQHAKQKQEPGDGA